MGEETEEEAFDGLEEDFEGDVGDDIDVDVDVEVDDDDIDLGDLDEDVAGFGDSDEQVRPRRSSGGNNKDDDDLLKSNYEQAVKANPKRAQKHQKRARIIEGVLDAAKLETEEGIAKAWVALQKQAEGAKLRKFNMSEAYTENDVISHPKFGEGYVVEILTSTKISVLFEDGIKKLAHNKG